MSPVIALLSLYLHSIAEGMFNTRSLNSLVFVVYCLLEATSALQEFVRPILSKTVARLNNSHKILQLPLMEITTTEEEIGLIFFVM